MKNDRKTKSKQKIRYPKFDESIKEHLEKVAEGYAQMLSLGQKVDLGDIVMLHLHNF